MKLGFALLILGLALAAITILVEKYEGQKIYRQSEIDGTLKVATVMVVVGFIILAWSC